MNSRKSALWSNYLDEAGKLHAKVIDARKELDDFYKCAAEDLHIKPALLKKVVRKIVLGEGEQDAAVERVIQEIEQSSQHD